MKKNLIKMTGMLCMLAVSAGIFGGCAKEESNVEVIRVWTNEAHSKDVITQMVSDYNNTVGKEEGIQIDYQVYGSDFNQVLNMALESHQAPEMFSTANDVQTMVGKGQLLALEDLPDMEEFLAGYEGELRTGTNIVDGKTYHVPFKVTTLGLIYNKDLFKKAGIVDEEGNALPPETWSEVREYAKRLTNEAENTYGFAFPLKWDSVFSFDLIMPFSNSVPHEGYDYVNGRFDYSIYKPAFEWLVGMKEDGSCFPGAEGLDNDMARAQFAAGRVGMMIGASWDVGVFSEQFVANCDWGVAHIPYLEGVQHYNTKNSVGPFVAINADAKEKDLNKIAKVYKWFNSKEVLQKLYEAGEHIPYDKSIIAETSIDGSKKGWKEFAELLEEQDVMPSRPRIKLEGDGEYIVYSKIWSGSFTVDEGLQDLTDRSNAALEKGIADGSIDESTVKVPDFKKNVLPE